MSEQRYRYRGFISYSQRDKKFAMRLHRALEGFRLPGGRKLGRFFRDDDELGSATSLGDALQSAIDLSEDLIVIASPNSAQSKWVNEEVIHFKKSADSAQQVFAVITDGTPNSTDAALECFVPALRSRISSDGRLTGEPDEPLAPDARKEPFRRLVTKIAAGLEDIPFDDLWQREKRRARTRAFISLAVIACIAAPLIWWGVTASSLLKARETELAKLDPAAQEQNFRDIFFTQLQDRQWADGTPDEYMITREAYDSALDLLIATDLNADGYQDFFAKVEHIEFCGSSGCLHQIMVHDEGSYRTVHQSLGGDLQVLSTSQNGFRDLALWFGALEDGTNTYSLLRYDGAKYQAEAYALCAGVVTYCGLSSVFTEDTRGETLHMVFDAIDETRREQAVARIDPRAIYSRLDAMTSSDNSSSFGEYDEVLGVDRSGEYALVRVWKTNHGVAKLISGN